MVWQIIGGVMLAGCLLALAARIYMRLTLPSSASGWLTVSLSPGREAEVEALLRSLCNLRRWYRLQGRIVLLTDAMAPEQARFVQALARQGLMDESMTLMELSCRLQGEMKQ